MLFTKSGRPDLVTGNNEAVSITNVHPSVISQGKPKRPYDRHPDWSDMRNAQNGTRPTGSIHDCEIHPIREGKQALAPLQIQTVWRRAPYLVLFRKDLTNFGLG